MTQSISVLDTDGSLVPLGGSGVYSEIRETAVDAFNCDATNLTSVYEFDVLNEANHYSTIKDCKYLKGGAASNEKANNAGVLQQNPSSDESNINDYLEPGIKFKSTLNNNTEVTPEIEVDTNIDVTIDRELATETDGPIDSKDEGQFDGKTIELIDTKGKNYSIAADESDDYMALYDSLEDYVCSPDVNAYLTPSFESTTL